MQVIYSHLFSLVAKTYALEKSEQLVYRLPLTCLSLNRKMIQIRFILQVAEQKLSSFVSVIKSSLGLEFVEN